MRRLRYLILVLAGCGSSKSDEAPHVHKKPRPIDAGVAMTPDPHRPDATPRAPDPMPTGADPLFPTALRAGTEDLFFLEEPVRGPHVTQLAMPDRAKLSFDLRAYCEIDELTVVCDHEQPKAKDLASVNVGMDHGRPVLVEWNVGTRVDQTVVLSYNAAGDLERMARLDETGTIDWVRTYAPAGKRYTSRELTGANSLEGCGAIELAIDNGRATARTCLQWLGDEMRDTNGVVRTEYDRDKDGFVIAETRQGFAGRLVAGVRDYVHRIDTKRDRLGRPVEVRYEAVAGHPVGSADEHGCAGADVAYEKNQEHERTCIDEHGKVGADEDGVTVVRYDHDGDGCEIETAYLDAKGKPAARDDIAGDLYVNDAYCMTSQLTCFGVDGATISCGPSEPAIYRYTRDAHGWVTSTTYADTTGYPSFDPNYGVAEVRNDYDNLGNELSVSCFDSYAAPIECGSTGFHALVSTYNDNGLAVEERFLDTYGQPGVNMGTSLRRDIYDNYDHLSESQDYDASGNLFEVNGMAIRRDYYDDSHRRFGIVLLDSRGQPASYLACYVGVYCPGNSTQAWSAVRIMRSPSGRALSNIYFDTLGQQIETVDCKVHQCWE